MSALTSEKYCSVRRKNGSQGYQSLGREANYQLFAKEKQLIAGQTSHLKSR